MSFVPPSSLIFQEKKVGIQNQELSFYLKLSQKGEKKKKFAPES